ncbi:glycosyltransferase family 4 protein [Akkermansiaceae bacterium]|nr:glycosyltransferase family 4 protein [Akkermansiaceae bacterium]
MKVLFIATLDIHIRSFHIPAMRWLREHGVVVDVAAFGDLEIEHCDERFHIDFQRSPFGIRNISAYRQLRQVLSENEYSLIHCHTPVGGLIGRFAARSARRRGAVIVYTAHGFHFCRGGPFVNWLYYYPVERWFAGYTDCLVTITREDYRLAVGHHFSAKHIEHIPGVGVDTEVFRPMSQGVRDARRAQLGYANDEFLLIYAAEFNTNKNQEMLIKALAATNESRFRLLLAGDGPTQSSCQRVAVQFQVEEQVEFLGYRKDLEDLLPICDCALASSRREGLPVNVMEAMSCGLPVVAAINRGHTELVIEGETGFLIQSDDHMAMSFLLHRLASDRELRARLGAAGRKRIQQCYSRKIATEAIAEIYQRLLGF